MAKTSRKAKTASAALALRTRYSTRLAAWAKLLPPKVYTDLEGSWHFHESAEGRLASGCWQISTEGWRPNPEGSVWPDRKRRPNETQVEWWKRINRPLNAIPDEQWERIKRPPLADAEVALADVAKELADAAVALHVEGAVVLRKWEHELRESNAEPSRKPSLMLPDVEPVVANVLLAMQGPMSPNGPSCEPAETSLDELDRRIVQTAFDNHPAYIRSGLWLYDQCAVVAARHSIERPKGTKNTGAWRARIARLVERGYLERNKPHGKSVRWTRKALPGTAKKP